MGSDERPVVEAFLLVDAPSQRLSYWTKALAALDSPQAPPLANVIALYDAHADQAVLSLRYHASPRDPAPLAFVGDIAMVAEVGLIQFGELSSRERQRFSTERLGRCSIAIDHKHQVVEALQELVRRLRFQRAASPTPRSTTSEPVPAVFAKGTRDELAALSPPASAPTPRGRSATAAPPGDPWKSHPPDSSQSRDPAAPEGPQQFVDSTRIIVDDELRYRVPPPLPRAVRRTADAASSPRQEAPRASSSPENAAGHGAPNRGLRRTTDLPPVGQVDVRTTILARYLRSGKWLPTRVASLSLKGATLMTGALPRVDDTVDVALSFAGHRALVRGNVDRATAQDAAVCGASTFGVQFDLDAASRRQLTTLLTAARDAHVTIKPPPARSTRRFVVEWSMCVGTSRGIIKADAFDVSLGGMFVRPAVALELGATCSISIVLDDGDTVVTGRAKVVRQLDEHSAAACGLSPGFGLSIVEMTDIHRRQWDAFIARIERRAGKRVLVGAPPARLAKLQAILSAAGYAVMGSGDPGSLVELANADARPVDAALIDSRWLVDGGLGSWVENVLSARQVPCVRAAGDARGARMSVDELLAIAD